MRFRLNAVLPFAITVCSGALACSGSESEGSNGDASGSGATSSSGSTPSSNTSGDSVGSAGSGTPAGSASSGATAGMSSSGTGAGGASGTTDDTGAATGIGGGVTSAGSTAGSTGGPIVGMISDLTIEPNPNSVLSAYVSWTTAEPSTSVVQFGKDALTWEIEGDAEVTDHRVLVIGMHASSLYQIRALSTGASGTLEGTGTFMTEALPSQIPLGNITVNDSSRAQPGWTLMNVQKGDGTNRALSGAPPAAVIYDEAGQPVWYYINRNSNTNERGGAISVDPTDVGVLMGPTDVTAPVEVDWAGNELWTCSDVRCGGTAGLSHHAGKLSNGNYIVMRDTQSGGGGGLGLISQVFEEFAPGGNQPVHTIGVEDAVTPPGGASGDWAHGNSISVDLENDVAYMSFRWLGLIKMTYSTRTMQWHLPASYGAQGMGDMTFVPADSQFSDIHDPEIHEDGTILFFDNGGWSGTIQDGNPQGLQTRAVEYMIDEQEKTATLVWEWPGDFPTNAWYKEELYVPFWGDADRLANGNVLIAAGRRGTAAETPESRIIEVTKDTGEVVWEMLLPKDHGVYRAERLYPLPLVRPIQSQ